MKNKIIWALFDDANSCYKQAIVKYFEQGYVIYSFGCNERNFIDTPNAFYQKIDLSLLNPNLFKELDKLPKPDIILASPPCQSFSIVDSGKMCLSYKKENWIMRNKDFYDERNKTIKHPAIIRYFHRKETKRINGESCIGAVIRIITNYKPKYWVIENPASSRIWEFIKNHWCFDGIANRTYYGAYSQTFTLKPTIFFSNVKLNLINEIPKDRLKSKNEFFTSKKNINDIPLKLIKSIISKLN